jgi:hypothetical protein
MYEIGTATDYYDLLDRLNTFLTTKGSAFGRTYTGTGNGTLTSYSGGASSIAETFDITATSSTTFSVVGTASGSIGTATVGTPFAHAKLNFTINAGGVAFVAGDKFSINTAPAWAVQRMGGCIDERDRLGNFTNLANAFDGNTGTFATLALASSPVIGCKMAKSVAVAEISWQIWDNTNAGATTIVLEYSDDGSSWSTQQTFTGITWNTNRQIRRFAVTSPSSHRWWRMRVTANGGNTNVEVNEVGFYAAVGSGMNLARRFEVVWKASGNDGLKNIFAGAFTTASVAGDYYNIAFRGFTNFADANPLETMGNVSGEKSVLAWNNAIPYWFIANGQRVIVIAKVSTTYHAAYIGLFYPYATPSQYGLPFMVAGSSDNSSRRWSYTGANVRNFQDPGRYGVDILCPDVVWRGFSNRYEGSGQDGSPDNNNGVNRWMYPAYMGASQQLTTFIRENIDGTYTLLPVIPNMSNPTLAVLGELDGAFWVSGFLNASENTIPDSGFTHLVVQNVYRTDPQHYMAVRLD